MRRWMVRSWRLAGLIVVFAVAGCGGSAGSPVAAPGGTTVVVSSSPVTGSARAVPAGPAAVICPAEFSGGLLTVDVATRRMSAEAVVMSDCTTITVDRIFQFSRDFRYKAINVRNPSGGNFTGYVAANQTNAVGYVNVSGAGSSGAYGAGQDGAPLFNPVTGDLWWTQNAHLFSNTVPPGTPVDHGPGLLYSFTTAGEAMPAPAFTSPDGSQVAVATVGGFTYGPSATMTSTCVQGYYQSSGSRTSTITAGDFCGGHAVTSGVKPGECQRLTGWIDNSAVACLTYGPNASGGSGSTLPVKYANALARYSLTGGGGTLTSSTMLTPPLDGSIPSSHTSPDGKHVFYVTRDAANLINAYLAPTDGTAAGSPPSSIAHWTSALSTTQIIGWITADGKLAS